MLVPTAKEFSIIPHKARNQDSRDALRLSGNDSIADPYCLSISRDTITRMISFVPSRIWCTRRSRTMRSTP